MPPRKTKRVRREDDGGAASSSGQRSLPAFESWMRANGISWDVSRIKLTGGDDARAPSAPGSTPAPSAGGAAAWAVYAATDIAEGDLLCTIPKDAILSVRTASCADMIQAERLGGGLGLIVAVMYERSLGEKSKWHGYLQSLPAREYLPIFWSQEELELLEGTELELKAEADREATQSDFETDVEGLAKKFKISSSCWTLESFREAASWVASRAFYVDRWHGNSLVPLADVFNHKVSLVELADEFAVAETADGGDESEGDEEGEDEGEDDEDEEDEDEDEEAEEEDEHEATEERGNGRHAAHSSGHAHDGDCAPGCDHHHHHHDHQEKEQSKAQQPDPQAPRQHILRQSQHYERDGLNLRLEIGICSTEREGQEVLDIVAASSISAGQEVRNTYGECGNAELVNKYGFALDRNPFNEVQLDLQQVIDAGHAAQQQAQQQQASSQAGLRGAAAPAAAKKASTSMRELRRRLRAISAQSSLLDPSSEPLLVMPGACISKPLLLLLHVLLAPEERFQAWGLLEAALDEALAGPAAAGAGAAGAAEGQAAEGAISGDHAVSLAQLPSSTMTPAMKLALTAAVSARAARLPGSLKATKAELDKLSKAPAAGSEHASAVRAALTLRLTEHQALQDVLEVCSTR